MKLYFLSIVVFACISVTQSQRQADKRAPRKRLETKEEILDFLFANVKEEKPAFMAFLAKDEEKGEIFKKDDSDGAYKKFQDIDKANPHLTVGMHAGNVLPSIFGVLDGQHYTQVDKVNSQLIFRIARFYKDNRMADNSAGAKVAYVTKDRKVIPVSDSNPEHYPKSEL